VHLSRGGLEPASEYLRSEVSIVCRMALATLGEDHVVPWRTFEGDYDTIRDSVSRVITGFDDFNTRVRQPDGFLLPHPPRDSRSFPTTTGKANFATNPLTWLPTPEGRVILQTLRSHDQYNTTIYGLDDRYRGVKNARKVIFMNPADIASLGLVDEAAVNLVSEWTLADGTVEERRADGFRVVSYSTPQGNAAAYYPETNPLIPLDHVATTSNTPVSKGVVVRVEPVTV
jgi:anaerobic selenocysteine-containing dehydrogenase